MRIGVDASCWSNRRGFGGFTRELLKALAATDQRNEYCYFVDQQTANAANDFPRNVRKVEVKTQIQPTEAASAAGRRSLGDLWKMSAAVAKEKLDLFFFPALYSYFPIRNRAKVAVTIMDMTPARLPRAVFPNRRLEFFWNLKEAMALWQADRIVTISEYSKKQIIELRGVAASRISVVYAAADEAFRVLPESPERARVLQKFGLQLADPYLLYVGGISPHKNLQLIARVFKRLKQESEFAGYKLVLAGDFEKDSFYSDLQSLEKLFEQLQLKESVIFTGYISDQELAHLYNAAVLFVFPSLQEGFGLPVIEAMACGAPVVASNAGSLPEIIEDAGAMFDPADEQAAFLAVRQVLQDPALREDMRRKGLERARTFQWQNVARQTLTLFDSMIGSEQSIFHRSQQSKQRL